MAGLWRHRAGDPPALAEGHRLRRVAEHRRIRGGRRQGRRRARPGRAALCGSPSAAARTATSSPPAWPPWRRSRSPGSLALVSAWRARVRVQAVRFRRSQLPPTPPRRERSPDGDRLAYVRRHASSRHARYRSCQSSRSRATVSRYSCQARRSCTGSLTTAPVRPARDVARPQRAVAEVRGERVAADDHADRLGRRERRGGRLQLRAAVLGDALAQLAEDRDDAADLVERRARPRAARGCGRAPRRGRRRSAPPPRPSPGSGQHDGVEAALQRATRARSRRGRGRWRWR